MMEFSFFGKCEGYCLRKILKIIENKFMRDTSYPTTINAILLQDKNTGKPTTKMPTAYTVGL